MTNISISLVYLEEHMIRNDTTLDLTWDITRLFRDLQIPYHFSDIDTFNIADLELRCYWYYVQGVYREGMGIIDRKGIRAYFLEDKLVAISYVYPDNVEELFWIQGRIESVIQYLRTLVKPDYSHLKKYPLWDTVPIVDGCYRVMDGEELYQTVGLNPFDNVYYKGEKVSIGGFEQDTTSSPPSHPNAIIATSNGNITVPISELEFHCNFID